MHNSFNFQGNKVEIFHQLIGYMSHCQVLSYRVQTCVIFSLRLLAGWVSIPVVPMLLIIVLLLHMLMQLLGHEIIPLISNSISNAFLWAYYCSISSSSYMSRRYMYYAKTQNTVSKFKNKSHEPFLIPDNYQLCIILQELQRIYSIVKILACTALLR